MNSAHDVGVRRDAPTNEDGDLSLHFSRRLDGTHGAGATSAHRGRPTRTHAMRSPGRYTGFGLGNCCRQLREQAPGWAVLLLMINAPEPQAKKLDVSHKTLPAVDLGQPK